MSERLTPENASVYEVKAFVQEVGDRVITLSESPRVMAFRAIKERNKLMGVSDTNQFTFDLREERRPDGVWTFKKPPRKSLVSNIKAMRLDVEHFSPYEADPDMHFGVMLRRIIGDDGVIGHYVSMANYRDSGPICRLNVIGGHMGHGWTDIDYEIAATMGPDRDKKMRDLSEVRKIAVEQFPFLFPGKGETV